MAQTAPAAELPHQGFIKLSKLVDGSAFLSHSGTAEKVWVTEKNPSLQLHGDYFFVQHDDGPSYWVSSKLRFSLHQDSTGKKFVLNKEDGTRKWLWELQQ
eukprot:5390138-Lingulodinium_polyedra.AAC.1